MKTRELIAQLQAADPSGELECCVHNADIHFVCLEEAYYDGCLQVLRRNPNERCYNITGADYVGSGVKVTIHPLSISDMILNDDDSPVGYIGVSEGSRSYYRRLVAERRLQVRAICEDLEWERFAEHMKARLADQWNDDFPAEEIEAAAFEFARTHLSPNDPMPEDILKTRASWDERRRQQYAREIEVDLSEGRLQFRRRSP